MSDHMKTDVLVVGSGPAGSTAAKYAAEKGVDVTIIERRETVGYPVRCGELIPSNEEVSKMFPCAGDISALFEMPRDLILRDVTGIDLIDPKDRSTRLDFTGYTTDRDRFDRHLVSEAQKKGANILMNCQFQRSENNVAVTSAGMIEYKVLIGADGPGSRVAKTLALPRNMHPYPAVTAQAKGDFDSNVKMFFGGIAPGAYGWIIPKDGRANVGVGFSPKFANGTLGEYFEKFVKRHDFDIVSKTEGKFVPSEGMLSDLVKGNGMIVGDAAGQVISVNGGGIPLALIAGQICGNVAADNINDGVPLSRYQEECEKVFRKPLNTAARNKRLADTLAFGSDRRTALCMNLLGKRRMGNLIRCKKIFP